MSTSLRPCPECGIPCGPDVKYCSACAASLTGIVEPPASEPLPPGTLLGSYRVLEILGEGGMGRVYAAEHIRLGRRVALKMLRPEYATNPVAVGRFFAEARAVNRISHENIVEVTDFCEKPGADNYYIMELLKGEDLTTQILRSIVLPLSRAVDICAQVASALAAVHEAGIVHRDLKPDNVFLVERRGRPDFVKVLDFGVAKLIDPGHGIPMGTTALGAIVGTPEYMSPEQAGGQPVDARSDIYSLGVMLYELVTGQLPFEAKNFGEMVIKHMTVPPKKPSAHTDLPHMIPPALERLILQMLAKDAAQRPQTMVEVEETLRMIHADLVPYVEDRPSGGTRGIRVTGRVTPVPLRVAEPLVEVIELPPGLDEPVDEEPAAERAHTTAVMRIQRGHGRGASIALAVLVLAGAAGVVGWFALRSDDDAGTAAAAASTKPAPPPAPAPAPVPAPAPPAPPPPEPTEVELRFTSTPTGAVVRIAGQVDALGTTPFAKTFPKDAEPVTFEFALDGYTTASQEVGLDAGGTIAAALTAIPVKPAPAKRPVATKRPKNTAKKPPSTVDRGGTMKVFED